VFRSQIEIIGALGERIRARRLAFGWPQTESARRAGVSYRTWRRLECEGKASIEDLVKAAIALRCDQDIDALFAPPAATSMDALLAQQRANATAGPKRARKKRVHPDLNASNEQPFR
jgi:transcriptional regulator with XRE-family HTH domain